MTIKTWECEYYPTSAASATSSDFDAIEHSIRKWKGLAPSELEKRKVHLVSNGSLLTDNETNDLFSINGSTCACCELNEQRDALYEKTTPCCSYCPITKANGRGCGIEWEEWMHSMNLDPMIALLETTRQYFLTH